MMKKSERIKLILILIVVSFSACQKQDNWLNEKTSKSDVVPETLNDFQAILDNTLEMNNRCFSSVGLITSDNLFIRDQQVNALGESERSMYLWEGNYFRDVSSEWNYGYRVIAFSNLVLEGLNSINQKDSQYYNIQGQAYFFRAIAMYNLVQLFCKSYGESTADTDMGLPIRESSDVNIIVRNRSSLRATYARILSDLQSAVNLLPDNQYYFQRPSAAAAKGLLAKVYLAMEDYVNAGFYANQALSLNNKLLDFNNTTIIQYNSANRFPTNGVNNPEIIFYAQSVTFQSIRPATVGTGGVAPELYDLYDSNDLRRTVFYTLRDNQQRFMGTYTGTFTLYCGIATNELYLIRAEAYARADKKDLAIDDLNTLLKNRFKTGTFTPLSAINAEEALRIILTERRKELPFTGNLRWEDLKRLNHDPRFQKSLTRTVNNVLYNLVPNTNRYVFPIPESEIQISGIAQNEK